MSAGAFCLSCDLRCISRWHFELIFADLLLSESLRILAFNCKISLALEALEALVTVKMLPFAPLVQRIVRPHRRFHRILLLALRNP